MLDDLAAYDGPLGPGPYWAANQAATIGWLQTNDLNRFRSFEPDGKALANFGGGSWWPDAAQIHRERARMSRSVLYRAYQRLGFRPGTRLYRRRLKRSADYLRLRTALISAIEQLCRVRDVDRELKGIEAALVGQPSDALDMGGRAYTPNFLLAFFRYLDMKRHIDFTAARTYVEIGPGVGNFAEVLAKLFPHLRIVMIDIPPQLYVLNQVQKAIFGDAVAGYQEVRAASSLGAMERRRIFILAPWQMPLLDGERVDIAFNSGFGEMRKDTVAAYLSQFRRWHAKHIYIRALDIEKSAGAMKTDDYAQLLPEYDLISRVQLKDASSLGPMDQSGRKIEVRPTSEICFGLSSRAEGA